MKERKPLMVKRSRFTFAVHEEDKFSLLKKTNYIVCLKTPKKEKKEGKTVQEPKLLLVSEYEKIF